MPVSSDTQKRTRSLLQTKPETVVDIADKWKNKALVKGSQAELDTHKRIYIPASNIERVPEDGCMKKIKIERSLKLRKEDFRNKSTNVLTNNIEPENVWVDSFGGQKDTYMKTWQPQIEHYHDEKKNLATSVTKEDKENEKLRVNIQYKPKMNITHQSSIRYKFIPKDN